MSHEASRFRWRRTQEILGVPLTLSIHVFIFMVFGTRFLRGLSLFIYLHEWETTCVAYDLAEVAKVENFIYGGDYMQLAWIINITRLLAISVDAFFDIFVDFV